MTNKESIRKNIELTFDFVRQIIDNPKLAADKAGYCEIEFIEKDFSSLTEKKLAKKQLIKVNHTFDIVKNKKLQAIAR